MAFRKPPGLCSGGFSFSLSSLIVVVLVVGVATALAIPSLVRSSRCSNERHAWSSLVALTRAQADFRSNDRDGNSVADYWTADVYALYGLIPGSAGTPDSRNVSSAIRLIGPSLAAADGLTQQGLYGSVEFAASIGQGRATMGYAVRALHCRDTHWDGTRFGGRSLLNDTDGPEAYGSTHDREAFGFIAFPLDRVHGSLISVTSERSEVWKYNLPKSYGATFTGASGVSLDSTSTTFGPELAREFTLRAAPGVGTFPLAPAAIGCSRPD